MQLKHILSLSAAVTVAAIAASASNAAVLFTDNLNTAASAANYTPVSTRYSKPSQIQIALPRAD
jgi:hypothetical protein